jgi:ADP-ribose pyrophosphatase
MKNGSDIVFRTPWFEIATVDPGAEPSGTTEPYYCLIRGGGVLAFVLDRAGNVVLVEQYRPPLGRTTLEMPAGTIDEGETPEQAVAREVLEETGFVCESWYQISPFRLMPNREDVIDYFFVGVGARKCADYQAVEEGAARVLPRRHFLELMKTRRFEQVAALGGMYLAERIIGVDLLMTDIREIESRLSTAPVCDDDAKAAT